MVTLTQFSIDRSHDGGTLSDENKKLLENLEAATNNADEVQTWVLDEILSRNAHVEYLQRHGLDRRTDRESFKKLIPVVTYENLKPDIDRIADGDTSPILCGDPITELNTSSVTSGGEMKLIPGTAYGSRRRGLGYSLLTAVMNHYAPGIKKGKSMFLMFSRPGAKSPGGLVTQTIMTSYHKSSSFLNRPFDCFTSPNETVLCPDSYQSMYSQLLCGLVQNQQVVRVGALFASGFIRAIQFLQKHWTLLCNDIRSGTVSPENITDSSVKEAVLKLLEKPNPELADFIENECGKDWKGIITRLWPNTMFIEAIISGSMSIYIPTLDYYSNGLPLVCTRYASTECIFGFNLKPLRNPSEVSYTFIPNMAYFEFLPISMPDPSLNGHDNRDHHQQQDHELVDLVNVKLGQEYEPVVTTYNGLYRYRVGDVVRVTGFKNKAPQFSFVCRRNVILSIDSDKTDEVDLQNAVANAINKHLPPLDISLVDYTSYADLSTNPGHYVVYWELCDIKGGSKMLQEIPPSNLEDCCLTIEESLSNVYRLVRASDKSIGPLEIKIVEAGTFDKLMEYAISRGSSMHQYKTPRCIKTMAMVELMNSRVVSNHFSQKFPKYVSGQTDWHNKKVRAPSAPDNSAVGCT